MIAASFIAARASAAKEEEAVEAKNPDSGTTRSARHSSLPRLACVLLCTAGLVLVASLFAYPAITRADYDKQQYQWCMDNVGRGIDYCCQQSGGVVDSNGDCVDPASIYTPAPPTTVTTRRLPPIIVAPPGTVVTP